MTAVSPDREIKIGERTFLLDGSFKTIKALQQGFGQDVLRVQARILDMRVDEIGKVIALACQGDEDEIGALIVDEVDITSVDYLKLKADLMTWLAVAMTPKRDREKKALAMAAMMAKLNSRGPSTSASALDTSAGPRPRSGKATSGK